MKNGESWIQRLAEGMELEQEALPGRTILEICGDSRVLIENHRGVQLCGQEEICVRTSFGTVRLRGQGLEVRKMSGQQLVILGCVRQVNLVRGSS